MNTVMKQGFRKLIIVWLAFVGVGCLANSEASAGMTPHVSINQQTKRGAIVVSFVRPNVIRVDVSVRGLHDSPTAVIAPSFKPDPNIPAHLINDGKGTTIITPAGSASLSSTRQPELVIRDASGIPLVTMPDLLENAESRKLIMERSGSNAIYGMVGLDKDSPDLDRATLSRPAGAIVKAGVQGNGGAPMFFTKTFGVLIDSVEGEFATRGLNLKFSHGSRKELVFYIVIGDPQAFIRNLAELTGHSPLPPRWTLGFLNSQWGIDEYQLRSLVAHYREAKIPLDAFILDYDWKAWGADNYGEWRWNSGEEPGISLPDQPDEFPDGSSGLLAKELNTEGVHLAGILKPRIMLYRANSHRLTEAAAYAESHGFWYQSEPPKTNRPTHRTLRLLDFRIPEERNWFWFHLEPSFDTGMEGWWNDEQDEWKRTNGVVSQFSSLEGFDMGRAIYEGQRSYSDKRVWSLNRNFYLGAQRYGYAEWSGDIAGGDQSMRDQAVRMLSILNLGEAHWSMDTGGFFGHPSPELYARWVQFAALTPIMRVHGDHNQRRQPWIYGRRADGVATSAIRLRYSLLPYIYSAEAEGHETGIGIVRPLLWMFPNDATAATQTREWMFGDAILAAPILNLSTSVREVYLPNGHWFEYQTGKSYQGPGTISLAVDTQTWRDLPMFVRSGSIIAVGPQIEDTNDYRPREISLDIFPSKDREAIFHFYDDDGDTYAYERGVSYRQVIKAVMSQNMVTVSIRPQTGTYATPLRAYLLRVHVANVVKVLRDGADIPNDRLADTETRAAESWTAGVDRFGAFVQIRISAKPQKVDFVLSH